MKILITGAGGFVGSNLCGQLLSLGHQVKAMDNFHKGNCDALIPYINNENFQFVYGDVTLISDCIKAVKDVDAIIHLAAIVGFPACKKQPQVSHLVNVSGTQNIILTRNERNKKIPICYASTGSIYGVVKGLCTEETPANYQSKYGEQKYLAEQMIVREENTVALRFATGFGVSPCMRVNLLINDLCYQAVVNKCLTIFEAEAMRTFISVEDMGFAFISSLDKLVNKKLNYKVYNAGFNNMNFSKREIAELIKERTGCLITYADIGKDEDARDYKVDYSRFNSEIMPCSTKTMEEILQKLLKVVPLLQLQTKYQ